MSWLETPAGRVARISSAYDWSDRLGAWKARWGLGRMTYMVPPGLYAVGTPMPDAPVLVTANYKMSYDAVRRSLAGRNVWLLVLETYGINVWCAAGKGTFGTGELVRRIAATGLSQVVTHRRLILPLLGAPGVAAHQVAKRSGFTVSFGAVQAADIPAYLDNGMVSTPEMQHLTFTFYERLVLLPVELVLAMKSLLVAGGIILLFFALAGGMNAGIVAMLVYAGAVLSGIILGPLLLPWLPGSSFAVKGWLVGILWVAACRSIVSSIDWSSIITVAAFIALPAVSAFYTLNFTGCTPYTSRSGVKKEMRLSLPIMAGAIILGIMLLLAGKFI